MHINLEKNIPAIPYNVPYVAKIIVINTSIDNTPKIVSALQCLNKNFLYEKLDCFFMHLFLYIKYIFL